MISYAIVTRIDIISMNILSLLIIIFVPATIQICKQICKLVIGGGSSQSIIIVKVLIELWYAVPVWTLHQKDERRTAICTFHPISGIKCNLSCIL